VTLSAPDHPCPDGWGRKKLLPTQRELRAALEFVHGFLLVLLF